MYVEVTIGVTTIQSSGITFAGPSSKSPYFAKMSIMPTT